MELLFYTIIGLLAAVLLTEIAALYFDARRAEVATQARDEARTNAKVIEAIDTKISGMFREFLPTDGATISFRINTLVTAANEARTESSAARSSADEARNAVRSRDENAARLERAVAALVAKVDALALAQANNTDAVTKLNQTFVNRDMVGGNKGGGINT